MHEESWSEEGSDVVIVEADEPLLFFASTQAAEQYLEPQDVASGVYSRAWGGGGRSYRIECRNGYVKLEHETSSRNDLQELRVLVVRYLRSQGVQVSPSDSLPRLLSRCTPYIIQ